MSRVAETVEIPAVGEGVDYSRIAAGSDFRALRRKFLGFVVPMTVTYIAWYLLFVLIAMYAPGIMAVKVAGDLTVGLVMGGLQFLSTFALATWYVRFANNTLDPAAAAIRESAAAERSLEPQPVGGPRPGGHRLGELRDTGVTPNRERVSGGIA